MMYEQRFREGLNRILNDKGIKQVSVAERSGIRPDVFSKLLSGKRRIFADEMAAICHTLDMTVEEVLEKGD